MVISLRKNHGESEAVVALSPTVRISAALTRGPAERRSKSMQVHELEKPQSNRAKKSMFVG
jgi:hypothetical protein